MTVLILVGIFLVLGTGLLTLSVAILAVIDKTFKASQKPSTYDRYHRRISCAKVWAIPFSYVSAVHLIALVYDPKFYLLFMLALVVFNALVGLFVRSATRELFQLYFTVAMGNPFALTHQALIAAVAGIDAVTDWRELWIRPSTLPMALFKLAVTPLGWFWVGFELGVDVLLGHRRLAYHKLLEIAKLESAHRQVLHEDRNNDLFYQFLAFAALRSQRLYFLMKTSTIIHEMVEEMVGIEKETSDINVYLRGEVEQYNILKALKFKDRWEQTVSIYHQLTTEEHHLLTMLSIDQPLSHLTMRRTLIDHYYANRPADRLAHRAQRPGRRPSQYASQQAVNDLLSGVSRHHSRMAQVTLSGIQVYLLLRFLEYPPEVIVTPAHFAWETDELSRYTLSDLIRVELLEEVDRNQWRITDSFAHDFALVVVQHYHPISPDEYGQCLDQGDDDVILVRGGHYKAKESHPSMVAETVLTRSDG